MIETPIHQMPKKTWNKMSFYINIILFCVIAIAIYFLIIDSYEAGISYANGTTHQLTNKWIHIGRDIAVLSIALTWTFGQLFRSQLLIMRRSW